MNANHVKGMAMTEKKPQFNWTKTKVDRLVKYRAKGMQWTEIGEKFGVSAESARCTYKKRKKEDRQKDHPLAGFTRDAIGEIVKKRRHKDGVFVITSAQPTMEEGSPDTEWIIGQNLHDGFFNNLTKNFCKKNDAELVILPTRAHVKALSDQPSHFDPRLEPYKDTNFATEYKFNKYLKAFDARINPQQANPLTGLANIGTREERKQSILIASPKQMLEVKATGNGSSPKLIASTGSITVPQYRNNRMGRIAADRHVVGALVVTIIGSKFIVHQIQCRDAEGTFNYMGKRYYPDGRVVAEAAEGFLAGDLHFGMEDVQALEATYEQLATLQPKKVFIGDIFEGASVSHHIEKDMIQRSVLPEHFKTLENELTMCRNRLEEFWSFCPEDSEVYAVDSNHNTFLHRYLRRGGYMKDVQNFGLAHDMVGEMRAGIDPLRLRLDPDNLINWTGPNDDVVIEGVQMASHGDRGEGGSRGNIKNLERIHTSCMIGHSHKPGIFYGAMQVGTLSKLRMEYNDGPSAWMHCNGVVYKNGKKSSLTILDGEWC